jgi:hypothetical protein
MSGSYRRTQIVVWANTKTWLVQSRNRNRWINTNLDDSTGWEDTLARTRVSTRNQDRQGQRQARKRVHRLTGATSVTVEQSQKWVSSMNWVGNQKGGAGERKEVWACTVKSRPGDHRAAAHMEGELKPHTGQTGMPEHTSENNSQGDRSQKKTAQLRCRILAGQLGGEHSTVTGSVCVIGVSC